MKVCVSCGTEITKGTSEEFFERCSECYAIEQEIRDDYLKEGAGL